MHDGSYRHVFARALIVEDLPRGFVREDGVSQVDYGGLEKKETEHEDFLVPPEQLLVSWHLAVVILSRGRGKNSVPPTELQAG
jgi:hypothetical protein